ncbi:MAG TPA: putative lipid II flippase FtsW [Cellvibrionaceae bacterium]
MLSKSTANVAVLKQSPDLLLVCMWMALLSVGLVVVASSSIAFTSANYDDSWYFVKRHLVFLLVSSVVVLVMLVIPTGYWRKFAPLLLLIAIMLLILVLVPGIGRKVNGAQRWIDFGFFAVQISEVVKFAVIMFFSAYFSERAAHNMRGLKEFFGLIAILAVVLALLVAEPDFGSMVVIGATAISIMFLAGVKLRYFIPLIFLASVALALLAYVSPYRMQRLVAFIDPWADQFNSGYQLTQSLIAFGRGEWFGVGLGNSLQKLFYLPEAHTDFVFSILAEEMGLVGGMIVLGIFSVLIARIWRVAKACSVRGDLFLTYAIYAIAVLFALQVFINIGMASGLLPTKGLTLPFVSYGGSSLIISCAFMAFVVRADLEMREVPDIKTPVTNPSKTRSHLRNLSEVAA